MRFQDHPPNLDSNLFKNYPSQGYPGPHPQMYGDPYQRFPQNMNMYPPMMQTSERVYYPNPYYMQYGTERVNAYPQRPSNYMNNKYMSQKMHTMEQGNYPTVPTNSVSASNKYSDPPMRYQPKHAPRPERNDPPRSRGYRQREESPRHFPGPREYKPSFTWKKKERRLSREKNPVDSDLLNVINKYKYGTKRRKY